MRGTEGPFQTDQIAFIWMTCVGVGFDDENFMRDSLAPASTTISHEIASAEIPVAPLFAGIRDSRGISQ